LGGKKKTVIASRVGALKSRQNVTGEKEGRTDHGGKQRERKKQGGGGVAQTGRAIEGVRIYTGNK